MNKDQMKSVVAFCILMQNHDGIASKSPAYIAEKIGKYVYGPKDAHKWGLDAGNAAKLKAWEDRWQKPPKKQPAVEIIDLEPIDG